LWLLASVICAIAVVIRGTVYLEARDWPLFTHPQIDEGTAYQIGLAFIDGHLPPEVYLKGPLYMYFVGAVAWVFGRDPMTVRLVQALLSSLSPVLIFLIAERLFGRWVGFIAGLLGAVFWTIVYYSLVLVDAALTTLLYLLLLCLLVRVEDGRAWKWPLCGGVLALGALSRPSVLAFAPVLAVLVLFVTLRRVPSSPVSGAEFVSSTAKAMGHPPPSPWRTALRHVITLTLGCLAVILPVTLRNRIVGGEWVLIGAYGGQNLWIANSPRSDGKNVPILVGEGVPKVSPIEPNDVWTHISMGNRIARYYAERAAGRRLKFGEIDAYFGRIGREYILNHPKEFLYKTFKRFCFFLNAHEYPNEADIYWFREASRLIKALSHLHFGILCPVAVVGVVLASAKRSWGRVQKRGQAPCRNASSVGPSTGGAEPVPVFEPCGNWTPPLAYSVGLLGSLWLPGLFFVINARFRIVIVALMIPFAAYGAVRLIALCQPGVSWLRRAAAVIAVAGLAAVSNTNLFGYAEKYYTDHRLAYAVACKQAGREDLLTEALERFEQALDEDFRIGHFTQTAVMEHAHPIGWLFYHYLQRGYTPKAFRYGSLMMKHDPEPVPFLVVAFFHLAVDTGHQEVARQTLETVARNAHLHDPAEVVHCLIRFGETYQDKSALLRALERLRNLLRQNPAEIKYHIALNHVQDLLVKSTRPATTATTTAPAVPTDRARK